MGPNGAGKSTTLRMMMGLMAPSAGSVRVLGFELPREVEHLRPRLGYMTQRFSLYEDLSVAENLEFAAEIFGLGRAEATRRIDEVLEEYGLTDRRDQRPATLSGGWKQRLALAAAVVHEPEILFLDEPTAGVDPDSRRTFWDKIFALAERGTTALVSTHYMDEAMRCHRLCVMREGRRVALGEPEHLTDPLAGRVLEIAARPIGIAIRLLQERPEVASLTQLGRRAHLLLTASAGERGEVLLRLLDHLGRGGVTEVEGEIAEPHLEDALIILSRGEDLPETAKPEKAP